MNQNPVWNGAYAPILKRFQEVVNAKRTGGKKKQYKVVILRPKPSGILESPNTVPKHKVNIKTYQTLANFTNSSLPQNLSSLTSDGANHSPPATDIKSEICEDNLEPSKIVSGSCDDDPEKNSQNYPAFQIFSTSTPGEEIPPVSQEIKSEVCETDPSSSLYSQPAPVPCRELERNSENYTPSGPPPYFTLHTSTPKVSTISEVLKSETGEEDLESAQLTTFSTVKQELAMENCISNDKSLDFSQDVYSGKEVSEIPREIKPEVYIENLEFSPHPEYPSVSTLEKGRFSAENYTYTAEPSDFNYHSSSLPFHIPEENGTETSSTVSAIKDEDYSVFNQTSQVQNSEHRSTSDELILTEHLVPVTFKPAITDQIESFQREPGHTTGHAMDATNVQPICKSLDEFMLTAKFFKCGLCDSAYREFHELGKHFRAKHTRTCLVCSKPVPLLTDMQTHLTHCQPTQQGPLFANCQICSKQVRDKSLGIHYRVHGLRPQEIVFRCDTCGRDFPFWKRNSDCVHLDGQPSTSRKMILNCCFCKTQFEELQPFQDHLKEVHAVNGPEIFPCNICSKIYSRQCYLQRHLECHERRRQRLIEREIQREIERKRCREYQKRLKALKKRDKSKLRRCTVCKKFVIQARKISDHQEKDMLQSKEHREVNNLNFMCTKCKERAKFKLTLLKYRMVQKVHRCQVCSRTFVTFFHLTSHMNSHVSSTEKTCVICWKTFSQNRNLRLHMKSHAVFHRFSCKLCRRKFTYRHQLNIHNQLHYNPALFCYVCCQDFDKLYRFVVHKKKDPKMHKRKSYPKEKNLHTMNPGNQTASYKCVVCKEEFRYKKWLDYHQMTTLDLKHNRFCFVCGKMFKLPRMLRKHMKTHPKEPEKLRKSFLCHICGKLFMQRTNLCSHIKSHTVKEIKNPGTQTRSPDRSSVYECGLCIRVFSRKKEMLMHRKVHERLVSHKCEVCSAVFASLSALSHHRHKVHHIEFKRIC
ncbi:zinc finger protein 184-like [Saccostrea echinata]|uniref:zinc finger protein 184-like n=1 Tax=Saccostrea echinata TaxID=191078 RepID=UPI002A820343|nr:zinc finger protein 184-like [Saccostrea echinata]